MNITIYDYELKFTEDHQNFGEIRKYFRREAKFLRDRLASEYNNAKGIGEVIARFPQIVEKEQLEIYDEFFKKMSEKGLFFDGDDLIKQFYEKLQYYTWINEPVSEYAEIIGEKDQLNSLREAQKNARGKWQGGGFGLSGAIKGAAMAGVLNWGNDILHSLGDSSKKSRDDNYIQKKLNILYKMPKTRYLFVEGAYECVVFLSDAIYYEMVRQGIYKQGTYEKVQAHDYYKQAKANENVMRMLRALELNPYEIDYYEDFLDLVRIDVKKWCSRNGLDEIDTENRIEDVISDIKTKLYRIAEFCKVDEVCDWIDNEAINSKMSAYIRKNKAFEYLKKSSVSKDGYWAVFKEYENLKLLYDRELPKSNYYYKKINDYIRTAEDKWPDLRVDPKGFAWFNVESNEPIKEFVGHIAYLCKCTKTMSWLEQTYFAKESEEFSAKVRVIKSRFPYLNLGDIIAINDTSMIGNLSQGVTLYEKAIVNMKDGKIFMLDEIEEVDVQHDKMTLFCYNGHQGSFGVNYIFAEYLEKIIKCYGTYRGSYKRREEALEEKKKQEREEIQEYTKLGGSECLERAYNALINRNTSEAYKYLAAIEDDNEDTNKLSMILNSCFFVGSSWKLLNNDSDFIHCVKAGIKSIDETSDYYKKNIKRFLDYRNKEGYGILQTLTETEHIEELSILIKYEFDYNKPYYKGETILDIVFSRMYPNSIDFNESRKRYGEIYKELRQRGGERKVNHRLGNPYRQYDSVYDFVAEYWKIKNIKQVQIFGWGADLKETDRKKYDAALEKVDIPKEDKLVLWFNGSSYGGSMAVTNSGIYYAEENGRHGHIYWYQIPELEIEEDLNKKTLFINGVKFMIPDADNIKSSIINFMYELKMLPVENPTLFQKSKEDEENEYKKLEEERKKYINKKQFSIKKKVKMYSIVTLVLLFLFFSKGAIMKIICVGIAYGIWRNLWEEFTELMAEIDVHKSSTVSNAINTNTRCPRCGKRLEADATVCLNCGQIIENEK